MIGYSYVGTIYTFSEFFGIKINISINSYWVGNTPKYLKKKVI